MTTNKGLTFTRRRKGVRFHPSLTDFTHGPRGGTGSPRPEARGYVYSWRDSRTNFG